MSVERIAHIGIAVESIEKWIGYYKDVLGLEYGGSEEVAEQKVRVAFLKIGESQIELLEPTSEDSPIAKFLEKRGGGIHHVAVKVDDIDAALTRHQEAGARARFPCEGHGWSEGTFPFRRAAELRNYCRGCRIRVFQTGSCREQGRVRYGLRPRGNCGEGIDSLSRKGPGGIRWSARGGKETRKRRPNGIPATPPRCCKNVSGNGYSPDPSGSRGPDDDKGYFPRIKGRPLPST